MNLLTDEKITILRRLIAGAERIVTLCHISADGDAIGSSLAMANYLRQLGKNVTPIVPDLFPDFLRWLPGVETIVRADKHPDKASELIETADLIVCLDFNTPSRCGEFLSQKLLAAKAKRVLIDHHLEPDVPADVIISESQMSSASEMVFHVIWQLGGYETMTNHAAQSIYCGMMTDTGGFTFNSTRPEIFFIISQLLAKGIDKDKIYRNVYNTFSESRLRLQGYVLYQKLNVMTPLHASYYALSRADLRRFNYIKGDAEGLVNMPLQIKGMRLSISLREDTEKPNLVWISLRSVDDFPCNELAAQFFNGGGHKNASGGHLNCTLQEAEKITREAIKSYAKLLS